MGLFNEGKIMENEKGTVYAVIETHTPEGGCVDTMLNGICRTRAGATSLARRRMAQTFQELLAAGVSLAGVDNADGAWDYSMTDTGGNVRRWHIAEMTLQD